MYKAECNKKKLPWKSTKKICGPKKERSKGWEEAVDYSILIRPRYIKDISQP